MEDQKHESDNESSAPDQVEKIEEQKSKTNNDDKGSDETKTSAVVVYCTCRHAMLCEKCGIPMNTKDDTKKVIKSLLVDERPPLASVYGNGPLIVSDVPKSAMKSEVVLGIDEAGRGCVLGPMVYGCAYWSVDVDETKNIPSGFRDSKTLNEKDRERLFEELSENKDIGFALRSILPSEISRHMLRKSCDVYNLNEMSHDATITLIRKIIENGKVKVKTAFIDTVGNPNSYKRKLEREFPGVQFVVESKADANYAPCSAASVVAKVMRDRMLESWKYSESSSGFDCDITRDFGSGYPSDPKCKTWMENLHGGKVFGYNDFLRFSWAPTKNRLEEHGVPVVFRADLDDDDELEQQKGMQDFLQKKRKRLGYFEKRNIRVKNSLFE